MVKKGSLKKKGYINLIFVFTTYRIDVVKQLRIYLSRYLYWKQQIEVNKRKYFIKQLIKTGFKWLADTEITTMEWKECIFLKYLYLVKDVKKKECMVNAWLNNFINCLKYNLSILFKENAFI